MKLQANARGRTLFAFLALALITTGQFMWAQNLGSAPAQTWQFKGKRARNQRVRFSTSSTGSVTS